MRLLERFAGDKRGNIATLAAVSLPLLIAGAAFGTEVSYWLSQKSRLRSDTDGAAITAANLFQRKETTQNINAYVLESLGKAGYDTAKIYLKITLPPSVGDPLEVYTRIPGEKFFSNALWTGNVFIDARTVIMFSAGKVCVLATHQTADNALSMQGSSVAGLGDCLAASNSVSSSAISFGGTSAMSAGCLYTAGNVVDWASHATLTNCPEPKINRPEVSTPLEGRSQPLTPASCSNAPNFSPSSDITVSPGCYKNGFSLKGIVRFEPGVYFLDGTDFTANSGANIIGSGVTFIFKGNASATINGGANINLSAPAKGSGSAYAGILFWGSTASGSRTTKINGNSGSKLEGIMSFENDNLEFNGNANFDTGCLRLVGKTVQMSGNSTFKTECDTQLGGISMAAGGSLKIIQ